MKVKPWWLFSDVTVIKSYDLRTTCGTKEELPYDRPEVVDDTMVVQIRQRKRGRLRKREREREREREMKGERERDMKRGGGGQ